MSDFNIREFKARDIAPMTRIISKIGLRQFAGIIDIRSVMGIVGDGDADVSAEAAAQIGVGVIIEAASVIIENFEKAENDLMLLMASLSGMKVEEVMDLSLADTMDLVYAIATHEGFSDFFTRAKALLGKLAFAA